MQDYPIKVLLADDSQDDYTTTRNLLTEIGEDKFILEWVTTSDEALEHLIQQRHDVYLIDYHLSQHQEWKLLKSNCSNVDNALIILLTQQDNHQIDWAMLEAKAADYLIKEQLNATLLDCSIRHVIDRCQTLKRLHQTLQDNARLALAIQHVKTGVIITAANVPDNPVIYVNPAFTAMTGYTPADILGENCRILQGPETNLTAVAQVRAAIANHQPIVSTLLNYRKDGTPFWVELDISPVFDPQGNLLNFIGLQSDITARKQAEEALRESEERYALAMQAAHDGIWDWNLRTNKIYYSPRWKTMLGYEEAEIGDDPKEWLARIHGEDRHQFNQNLATHLSGGTLQFETEHRMQHRDGTYRWMRCRGLAVRDSEGQVVRIAGSQTDITLYKQTEEQLLYQALYDTLTDLPNRTLLTNRLQHLIKLVSRGESYLFAVLFLDVDRFKVVNDSLGHVLGDQLLVAIAQRLSKCLRPSDTVARLGGDEFVILLEGIRDLDEVTAIADRILCELAQPFNLGESEIFTSVSIGIALNVTDYESAEEMIRDADTAMYRAKAKGRFRYEIFNPGMHQRAVALLQLETDLRRALDRQEFLLHYQPIVSLATQQIIGFEALLRWKHPERGMVSPAEFIPIAEETGLIVPIGLWVLKEACAQMKAWKSQLPQNLPLTISVNLSGKQFTPQLVEEIRQILADTGLEPQHLRLEITESVLIENTEAATTLLFQLRELGIHLSMDDFGTGYSSLNYLHRFPIDTLKIDRSFISQVDRDGEQLAIVRTIMTLAWNLGMDVIAEGVETSKQLAQLKALKCDAAQGYFFYKPLDSQTAERFLHLKSR
jgi:diguanylate cyclase (GGDEF)-like protein/PAS domain S-box-containing protein